MRNSNGQFTFLNFNKKDITKIFFDEIKEYNIFYQDDKMNKTHKKNLKYYLIFIFSFLIFFTNKNFWIILIYIISFLQLCMKCFYYAKLSFCKKFK